jgi:hypothetical protein
MEEPPFYIIDEAYYGNGEFEFINNTSTRAFLKSAHKAISICELWDWLRIYEPPPKYGFMFSTSIERTKIDDQMYKDPINMLHSGSSYGGIMREMEFIAKNGYNKFKNLNI